MSTGIAIDAGKAVMRVTALDEPLDRAFFHHALKSTRLAKLPAVPLRALPQGARPGVAGAIHPFSFERTATLHARPSSRWLALRSHTGRNAPAAARRDRNPADGLKGASRSTAPAVWAF